MAFSSKIDENSAMQVIKLSTISGTGKIMPVYLQVSLCTRVCNLSRVGGEMWISNSLSVSYLCVSYLCVCVCVCVCTLTGDSSGARPHAPSAGTPLCVWVFVCGKCARACMCMSHWWLIIWCLTSCIERWYSSACVCVVCVCVCVRVCVCVCVCVCSHRWLIWRSTSCARRWYSSIG